MYFLPFYIALQKTQITIQNKITSSCCKSIFYKPIRQSRLEYDIYIFNIFKHKTFSFLLQLNAKCSLHVLNKAIKPSSQKRNPLVFSTLQKHFEYIELNEITIVRQRTFSRLFLYLFFSVCCYLYIYYMESNIPTSTFCACILRYIFTFHSNNLYTCYFLPC